MSVVIVLYCIVNNVRNGNSKLKNNTNDVDEINIIKMVAGKFITPFIVLQRSI